MNKFTKTSPDIFAKTKNDGQYIIKHEDKVRSVRFVNQGNTLVTLNTALKIPAGSDIEFKADDFCFLDSKFSIKFEKTPTEDKYLPYFVDKFNNLVIILTRNSE